MKIEDKILNREQLAEWCNLKRTERMGGARIVFTNGCFDILHAGHVDLLRQARALGTLLVVGANSDASVRRLKGESRPVNSEDARAFVLAALGSVDAVYIFEEDTPDATIETVRPHIHVKGGDYRADELPEAEVVRKHGGEIVIVPLREGFSTTGTIEKMCAATDSASHMSTHAGAQAQANDSQLKETRCIVLIPARFGSTRFPGKPLALLENRPVVEHVARAALRSQAETVLVATDDHRIADAIKGAFWRDEVDVVLTSPDCQTGTDRLAEAIQSRFADIQERLIVVNVQGDEPFIDPHHINLLMQAMRDDTSIQMATLATPLDDAEQINDTNVVKVVCAANGDALYFSRLPIPFQRDMSTHAAPHLRHLGVYAYEAKWLLQMAALPPSPLEEIEKLEQLRALENGARIRVIQVESVVNIAIDTPRDLELAQEHWNKGTSL